MGLELEYIDGQTPLDEEEKEGLLIPTIATRGELDEFEQQNIEQAVQWTLGRSFKPEKVFTEDFVRMVHKRMYADVWAWAGEFRKTNKNIGIDKWQIPTELRYLLDDVRYWHENNTYPPDEIAVRFKHRKKKVDALEKEISRLKSGMANSKQFNNKVELNLKLKATENELQSLLSDH